MSQVESSHIVEIALRESAAQGLGQIFRKTCQQMISIDRVRFALLLLLHDSFADLPIGLNQGMANAIIQFRNVLEQLLIGVFLKMLIRGLIPEVSSNLNLAARG